MKNITLLLILISSICYGQDKRYQSTSDSLLLAGETELAIAYLEEGLESKTDKKTQFECLSSLCATRRL
jgi:Tfp pilus assembly protein PilF